MLEWVAVMGLGLVAVAWLRVRELDVTAAYLLYAAGGVALLAPCACAFPFDAYASVLDYGERESMYSAVRIVDLVLGLVAFGLMLAGIVRAARALPPRGGA